MKSDEQECLTCRIERGEIEVPGGLVYRDDDWAVDHCIGPAGVGAMVVRARRHVESLWDLSDREARSIGLVIRGVSGAIVAALRAERVYVSLWVDRKPYHVHWVLWPRYKGMMERYGGGGLELQSGLWSEGPPEPAEVAKAAAKVKAVLAETPML